MSKFSPFSPTRQRTDRIGNHPSLRGSVGQILRKRLWTRHHLQLRKSPVHPRRSRSGRGTTSKLVCVHVHVWVYLSVLEWVSVCICVCLQLCMHLLCRFVTTACHHVMCHHTLSDWQCQYSGLSPRHHVSTQCHHVNTKACHSFIPPRHHVIKSVLKHDSSEIQEPSKKNVMKAVYAADSLQQTETPQGLFDVMGDTEVI